MINVTVTIHALLGHVMWIKGTFAHIAAQILRTQPAGKERNEAEGEPIISLEHSCRAITATVMTKEGLIQIRNQLRGCLFASGKGTTTTNNDDGNTTVTHSSGFGAVRS